MDKQGLHFYGFTSSMCYYNDPLLVLDSATSQASDNSSCHTLQNVIQYFQDLNLHDGAPVLVSLGLTVCFISSCCMLFVTTLLLYLHYILRFSTLCISLSMSYFKCTPLAIIVELVIYSNIKHTLYLRYINYLLVLNVLLLTYLSINARIKASKYELSSVTVIFYLLSGTVRFTPTLMLLIKWMPNLFIGSSRSPGWTSFLM